jgi:hypothetical protein
MFVFKLNSTAVGGAFNITQEIKLMKINQGFNCDSKQPMVMKDEMVTIDELPFAENLSNNFADSIKYCPINNYRISKVVKV